ncbi:MAG: sigma factor-like helix-turn-helix DNA-binding protein [Planctomycetota bacterium]
MPGWPPWRGTSRAGSTAAGSAGYRTTVLLRYFEDLPTAQVATRMGVPHATVRTRLQRAMARLRKDLGSREGGQWQARYAALFLGVPEFSAAVSTSITKTLWTGAFLVGTKLKVAAAAVMLAAGLGVTLWVLDQDPLADGNTMAEESGLAANRPPQEQTEQPLAGGVARPPEGATGRTADRTALKAAASRPTWQLRGRVTDRLGRPVARVPVVLESVALQSQTGPKTAPEREPEFLAPAGRPGSAAGVAVEAVPPPAPPGQGQRTLGYSDAEGRFDLTAPKVDGVLRTGGRFVALRGCQAQPTPDADVLAGCLLVVAPVITVSGTVRDPQRNPLVHVSCYVSLQDLAGYPGILDRTVSINVPTVSTDGRGRFQLDRVPGIPEAVLQFTKSGFEGASLEAPDRDTTGVDVVMKPSAPQQYLVSGVVRDESGKPVPGAAVTIGYYCRTQTDAAGRFVLKPNDIWTDPPLVAVKHGYQAAVVPQVCAELRDNPAKPQKDLVLVLPGRSKTIRGTVVDHRGVPRKGLRVYPWDPTFLGGGLEIAEVVAGGKRSEMYGVADLTDADGAFELTGLVDRRYILRVHDEQSRLTLNTAPVAAGTDDLRIVIPQDAMRERVSGRIVAHTGAGIPDVDVFVEVHVLASRGTIRNARGVKVTTDRHGHFSLPDVSRREVYLAVRGDSIVPAEHSLPADHSGHDLRIQVERRCHFKLDPARFRNRKRIWVEMLDDGGKQLTIYTFSAHGWSSTNRWHMWNKPGTQALAVSERAAWLVVHEGFGKNTEVLRHAIALKPGVVTNLGL